MAGWTDGWMDGGGGYMFRLQIQFWGHVDTERVTYERGRGEGHSYLVEKISESEF